MAKNVLMKYYNPATQTYQEVHPLTKTTNVYNNEGKTVQELIDEHKAAAAPHSGHETPTGAQAKVDAHANRTDNPHSVTKSQVGLGNVENYGIATQAEAEAGSVNNKYMTPLRTKQAIDVLQAVKSVAGKTGNVTLTKNDVGLSNVDNVKQASKTEFVSHNNDTTRHITSAERTAWNNKAEVSQIPTKISQLENDREYVTQEELGDAGYGDMLKSVYDTDNDGKVDMAEAADSVPWTGVTGKPSTFPPSSHTHIISNITGLQVALDGKMSVGPLTWNDLKGVI